MGILEVYGGNKDKKLFKHATKGIKKGQTASICPKDNEFIQANFTHFKLKNLSAGDTIIMNKYAPHLSDPNNGDKCRFTMDIRFYDLN